MPGVSNMVRSKVAALRQVKTHIATGGKVDPATIQAHVPDVNCKCHQTTQEAWSTTR